MNQACEKVPSLRWWTGPVPYLWAICLFVLYGLIGH